ncbi:MAG: thioredoxin family protein [Acidimicrobiia bacterium]|nr:thioredoxin family protein [Acidimicrobiia bacterium]
MAATSTMLALGTDAPHFTLPDVISGEMVSIDDFAEKTGLLVMFICVHCPYVKHVNAELGRLGRDYAESDIGIVAISSNDIEAYPEDSPDGMRAQAEQYGFVFPYLYDEDQTVAAAYTAMCTPDFFLFGPDRRLVYRGRLDESRPNSGVQVTGADLRMAMDALFAGEPIPQDQFPSMGCSIKWRDGAAPAYFKS